MALFKCGVFLIPLLLAFAFTFTNAAGEAEASSSLLPPFPCIPGRPRAPWLPPCDSPPASPQPAECYTSVSGLTPCADFLTSTGVPAPPAAACCDGLRSIVTDAPICLCHVVNGDLGRLLPAPMLRLRMLELPRACAVALPRTTLRQCIRGPVPPMNPPPSTPDEPTPSAPPPESPSTPPPAATPPESPSTPPPAATPPESPSTPPPAPAAASPPAPAAATPPESPPSTPQPEPSPSTPPPTPAATTPAESPSTPPPTTTQPPSTPSPSY